MDRDKQAVVPIGTTAFTRGWHDGVAMRTYLGDPAWSASRLWNMRESTPAHLAEALEHGADKKTDARELGTITHAAVFEPKDLENYKVLGTCEATVQKTGKRCTNSGIWYRDGSSYCGVKGHDPYEGVPMEDGILTVDQSALDLAGGMKASLFDRVRNPTSFELLSAVGRREVTGFCQDPKTGLWMRVRPDLLIEQPDGTPSRYHWSVVNLKTTGKSAGDFKYPKDAERAGYYYKAAFYRMVVRELWALEPQHFYYPVVESYGRHEVNVFRMNEDAIDIGEIEVREDLDTLARCVETGNWPAYGSTVKDLSLSEYRMRLAGSMDFLEVD